MARLAWVLLPAAPVHTTCYVTHMFQYCFTGCLLYADSKGHQSANAPIIDGFFLNQTGRQRLALADASLPATASSFPPSVLPAGPEPSGAALHFAARQLRATEPPMGSQGWSRPFSPQSQYTLEAPMPLQTVFRHRTDQVSKPHSHMIITQSVAAARPYSTHSSMAAQVLDLCADVPLVAMPLEATTALCSTANPNIC